MKIIIAPLIVLLTFLIAPKYAFSDSGIEEFAGNYEYVSGPQNTTGCGNFKIDLNESMDGLNVFHIDTNGYEFLMYEFPYVNKGTMPWQYNWGDGVARGTQKVVYNGRSLAKEVQVKGLFGRTVRRNFTNMYFEQNDKLTIKFQSADSNYECRVIRIN